MSAPVVPDGQRNRELFHASITRFLPKLYHVVRHQLAYLEAIGDVLPGELTADDVVDAVVLRAHRELVDAPSARKLGRRLIALAREQIRTEVASVKSWRARTPVRTEDDVPETPPAEAVSMLGDEILDFYEPDEDLKVEDVLPDLDVPTPDEVAETDELRACVDMALATMPRQWRRALLRRYVDDEARPDDDRVLDHARQYLRQKLVDAGCAFKETRS